MKTTYTQCGLVKELKDHSISQVSWIPTKYAVLDKILKLKDENGDWDEGWKVTIVGNELANDLVPDWHKARKVHRENTGDSQPKKSP